MATFKHPPQAQAKGGGFANYFVIALAVVAVGVLNWRIDVHNENVQSLVSNVSEKVQSQ